MSSATPASSTGGDYGEEGLTRCQVALWLDDGGLVVEYGGDTLSRYDVSLAPGETKLVSATDPRLFPTKHPPRQLKLFALDKALVEGEWLKALGLEAYAPRSRERRETLQGALFSYLEAL